MSQAFHLEDLSAHWNSKIWKLTFDLPNEKVNKLSADVMAELEPLLTRLESQASDIDCLILCSGKKKNFIAGADIKLIQSAPNAQAAQALSSKGQSLLNRWEDLPFPTVAAIDGSCLGGGTEFALACSAIVMSESSDAKIGLPEVMLGFIPGMGGCIRLPAKAGLVTAFDLILTGKNLNGQRAFRAAVADACIAQENFLHTTTEWAEKNMKALKQVASGQRPKGIGRKPKLGGMGGAVGSMMESTFFGRSVMFSQARKTVLAKSKGHYPAPLEAIDVLKETGTRYGVWKKAAARDRAMEREAAGFGKMSQTEVSKNLVRLFFLTEEVKKSNGLESADSSVQKQDVDQAGVLGAGVMGGGIAQLFGDKGIHTRMKDIHTEALETGMKSAAAIFSKKVKRRRISKREMLQKMNRIAPVLDFEGFGSLDLVVEAVIEKMDVKKSVLKELEEHVRENCVLASNTSSLSISEMQSVLSRPERFVGMHFFNPVHMMPLVEVIRGEKTSDETVVTTFELSKRIGKTPIVVKDAPGFLVNRLLAPYLNESTYLLGDGASIEEIDRALTRFGMPMGPMELIDEVGVDVADKVGHILHEGFGERMSPAPFNARLVQAERMGKKNGKGMYHYEKGSKKGVVQSEVYSLLEVRPKPGTLPEQEMVERCVFPMINEAARCLDEQIVYSASEVDLGMIMGTGFPPFRGGLLRYADSLGADHIVTRLKEYEKRFGARFTPAPGLVRRMEQGVLFYS